MRHYFAPAAMLAVYLLASPAGFAREDGPGSGGGGGAVLCLNPDQSVKSVDLVDLVESVFYDKTVLSPALAALSWEEQVKIAMNRIAFADPEFHSMLSERLQFVHAHLEDSLKDTAGTDLIFPAPQDLSHGRVPPMRLGCQLVGAAVFNDNASDNKLTISSFLWSHLSEMNKAALVLHESVYYTHRTIYMNLGRDTSPDSSATRALVGFLFSTDLENNSATLAERARFQAPGAFRSYDLGMSRTVADDIFRNRVRTVMKPLLPYFLKGAERPLFLDTFACNGGGFDLKVIDPVPFQSSPGHSCIVRAVAHLWPSRVDVRQLEVSSRNEAQKALTYKYEPHKDGLLEDVRLECKSKNTLERFNPGFRLFCGNIGVAQVPGSTAVDVASLPVKKKADFAPTFLHDFEFAAP